MRTDTRTPVTRTPTTLSAWALAALALAALPQAVAQEEGSGSEFVPENVTPPSAEGDPSEQPAENRWVPQGPDPTTDQPNEDIGPPVTYDPEGRRDPFRPLIGTQALGPEGEAECTDPNDMKCLLHTDVRLTAIIKTATGNIAQFEGGPRRSGYFAREGDRFKTAYVYQVDYENLRVVIREELDDPRLLKPYRDYAITLYREDELAPRGRP